MSHHLNSVELAKHRILMALYLDMEKQPGEWMDRRRMADDYGVVVDERLFASIVEDMKGRGWAETWTEIEDGQEVTAASLSTSKHARILGRILDTLEAKVFEVDWQTKRIATDARDDIDANQLIPVPPKGWMMFRIEPDEPQPARSRPVSPSGNMVGGNVTQTAARDINVFYGPATQNHHAPAGESGWNKTGVILTAVGVVIALIALYFTDSFPWHWQSKPRQVEAGTAKG